MPINRHYTEAGANAPEWGAARRVLAHAAPPDSVEAALLQAFAQRHARQPWYRRWTLDAGARWAGSGAMACMLAIVVAAISPVDTPHAGVAAVVEDGFLSLVPAGQLGTAVQPRLQRADVPRRLLVQLGIPIAEDAPDELVHAEMLVAANGEPLAIRLAVN
jgi:hypothetical protein